VSSAAEGTKTIGSKIYEKGSEQLEYVNSNPMVNDFTEKSKSALGSIGGAVTGITSSVYKKVKTVLIEEDEDDQSKR